MSKAPAPHQGGFAGPFPPIPKATTHTVSRVTIDTHLVIEAWRKMKLVEQAMVDADDPNSERMMTAREHVCDVKEMLMRAFNDTIQGRIARIRA